MATTTVSPQWKEAARRSLAAEQEKAVEAEAARLAAEHEKQLEREREAERKRVAAVAPKLRKALKELYASDEQFENLVAALHEVCAENVRLYADVVAVLQSGGINELSSIKSGHAVRPAERLWKHMTAVVRPVFQKYVDVGLRNVEAERWAAMSPTEVDGAAMRFIGEKYNLKL